MKNITLGKLGEIEGGMYKSDSLDCFTVKQVSQMFSVTERTVYNWLKEKKLKSIQVTKIHYIPKENILQMFQSN